MRVLPRSRTTKIVFLLFVTLLLQSSCKQEPRTTGLAEREKPVTVRFGMLPYADHTYAIIGAKQDWFKEVGIDFKYQAIKVEDIIPYLKNGTLEVVSCPPGILFASYENAPGLRSFVFGDLFQGYAIMAQSGGGYKSYSEFVAQGLSPAEAIKAAVRQLRGKVFAYPTETAIKPFIDLSLRKGGVTRNDFKSLVLDDPLTVNAMRNKQADFQVGGVPSRLILQREGFKPILSSNDLAMNAKPSPDSPELASILQNGWATTKDYYEKNSDTILRLASVNYRIMRFMNDHENEALVIHMAYLSQISGQPFSAKEGHIIYSDLDPFVTFEGQHEWFHNPQSPYFYANVNGSILNNFISQGIFKHKPPSVEDVIFADDVYLHLEKLKASADVLFAKIVQSGILNRDKDAAAKFDRAKRYYDIYDFLDAERLANEIVSRTLRTQ